MFSTLSKTEIIIFVKFNLSSENASNLDQITAHLQNKILTRCLFVTVMPPTATLIHKTGTVHKLMSKEFIGKYRCRLRKEWGKTCGKRKLLSKVSWQYE